MPPNDLAPEPTDSNFNPAEPVEPAGAEGIDEQTSSPADLPTLDTTSSGDGFGSDEEETLTSAETE